MIDRRLRSAWQRATFRARWRVKVARKDWAARPLVWGGVATFVICAILYVGVDRPVARAIHAHLPDGGVAAAKLVSQIGVATGYVIAAFAILAGAALGMRLAAHEASVRRLRRAAGWALFLLLSLAASGLVSNLIKTVLGRTRPRALVEGDLYGFRPFSTDFGMNALPSGHSQTIWAIATVLILAFPRAWGWFAAAALAVSLSRVFAGAHYPSDVLAGAYVGIAVPVLLWRALHAADGRWAEFLTDWRRKHG